jgi:hypothetical protein
MTDMAAKLATTSTPGIVIEEVRVHAERQCGVRVSRPPD